MCKIALTVCEEQLRIPGSGAKRSILMTQLDTDHMVSVLQLLPVQDVLSFRATCSHYREVASSDVVWEFMCRRDWGTDIVSQVVARRSGMWMEFYHELYTLKAATWRKVKQLGEGVPKGRANHSLRVLGTKLVLFGGGHYLGQCLDDTWISLADPRALLTPEGPEVGVNWRLQGSKEPLARFGQSCSLVGDVLVMFGGINVDGQRLCDTWTFSLGEDAYDGWRLLHVPTSPPPRGAHGGCYAGRKRVVVFGGINVEGERLSDTWLLDLEGTVPTWREIQQLSNSGGPSARAGHTLTWIGDSRVLLFGGRGKKPDVKLDVLNDTWVLDLDAEFPEWVELRPEQKPASLYRGGPLTSDTQLPPPRAGHSGTLIAGGRVLIMGGEDASRMRKCDMWVLDPAAAMLVRKTPLPDAVPRREVRVVMQSASTGRARHQIEEDDEEAQVVPSGAVPGREEGLSHTIMDERGAFSGATGGLVERYGEAMRRGRAEDDEINEEGDRAFVTKRQLWKRLRAATDEGPGRRSFHAACAVGNGLGVLVFGGFVDSGLGSEVAFDDEMFVLQLVSS
eukprot:TRINITY_DN14411_c0_g1_i1.p1 TRINITY_DN14411_c0_g1~~TRINITY_DN14411_c0_g1_i1.p1  ORF type:complete len:563 (-),score=103.73 TRINITY_DN14411_c0_g1_i1:126-1814(-)